MTTATLEALEKIEQDQAADKAKLMKVYRVHITDLADDNELSASASKALAKAMHQLGIDKTRAQADIDVLRRVALLEPDAMDAAERIHSGRPRAQSRQVCEDYLAGRSGGSRSSP